ncbi:MULTISPECIES: universal stress protein [Enterococcus]|uniref:universal stress protein n=1 Tax=Enterococcus TaxID=1350 RepID=UPI00065E6E60|nr:MULTISPECIES: universal stress protein [Enterococcus]KAF1302988.1 universal stress protein UspA [Enterococcus sp. JM9B]
MNGYNEILVAIDGSKNADAAFDEAIRIASYNQARLFIAAIINEEELSTSSYAYTKILKEEQEKVEMDMLKRIHDAKEAGIEQVEPIVEVGNPKVYITRTIPEAHSLDLIIVGATGMGSITREKAGSTTQYIVNNAPCSVLMVK